MIALLSIASYLGVLASILILAADVQLIMYAGVSVAVSGAAVMAMYRLDPAQAERYLHRLGIGIMLAAVPMGLGGKNEIAGLCIIAGIMIYSLGWKLRNGRQDFDWYIDQHPEALQAGRIHCYSCGSARVHTERLMNRQYMRRHFCVQCGTTLYHSPE